MKLVVTGRCLKIYFEERLSEVCAKFRTIKSLSLVHGEKECAHPILWDPTMQPHQPPRNDGEFSLCADLGSLRYRIMMMPPLLREANWAKKLKIIKNSNFCNRVNTFLIFSVFKNVKKLNIFGNFGQMWAAPCHVSITAHPTQNLFKKEKKIHHATRLQVFLS